MGKVKPMKPEATRAPHTILLDDYTLTASGTPCVPTPAADGTNPTLTDADVGANDEQNIPVISVTTINHPLESRLADHRKSQANDPKRSQLTSMVKSESLPTNISCDMRPNSVSAPSSVGSEVICRICHSEAEPEQPLISPCLCSGTLKFVHQDCLHHWIKSSDLRYCELCKFEFIMKVTTKPFSKWQNLDMSAVERRKIICSVTFHVIALTCVIWSLYVLIERTTEEINNGVLEWPFWTKLIVMAIGFVGGVVFMYVQCRMYVGLCRRWRAHNRTFVVKSVPLDVLNEAQKAARHRTLVANAAIAANANVAPPPAAPVVESNTIDSTVPAPPSDSNTLEAVVISPTDAQPVMQPTPTTTTQSCLRIGSSLAASTCSITSASSCAASTATSTAVIVADGLHPTLMPQRHSTTQSTHWITSTIL